MRLIFYCRALAISMVIVLAADKANAQRFLADYDSTLFVRDTLKPLVRRFENIHLSGYIQPQFQVAQQKGAPSFEGGNFSEFSNSRFMLRRARVKVDYIIPSSIDHLPKALFTFQIDATERGVNVRDMFVRLYDPKTHNFAATVGLFARPFGYELNLSSAYRETPERGRMSQILMPTERDLGFMATYEPQKKGSKNPVIKFDAGVFNGQGLSGTTDFDSFKDIISRLTIKPLKVSDDFYLSGGLSLLYGGWAQGTKYVYKMGKSIDGATFVVDSSLSNIGEKAPRHYYGSDVQLVKKYGWGKTELRAEYWTGKQSGTAASTTNPGTLPLVPTYIRNFDGAFFYFLQNIINNKWELMVKYDWYDPNTKVKEAEIGKANTNLTTADIKFSTLGTGLTHYINNNVKLLVYYDMVKNEKTSLTEFAGDMKDNIFTCRLQMRF